MPGRQCIYSLLGERENVLWKTLWKMVIVFPRRYNDGSVWSHCCIIMVTLSYHVHHWNKTAKYRLYCFIETPPFSWRPWKKKRGGTREMLQIEAIWVAPYNEMTLNQVESIKWRHAYTRNIRTHSIYAIYMK